MEKNESKIALKNTNCQLRLIKPSDCQNLFIWRNKDHVRLVMHHPEKISYENHKDWFQKMLNDPDKKYYIFELNGKPLGILNFSHFKRSEKTAVWGFYLGEENAPKGTGTIMCKLGLEVAKEVLGLENLQATVNVENIKSIKIHESLGFKKFKEEGSTFFYLKEL